MELITERTQVRNVAKLWRRQYPNSKQDIAEKLDALDVETATAEDVAAIIGNDSWCKPSKCNECGETVPVAVMVGEEPDYESATATLCFSCVEKALSLMGSNVELRGCAPLHSPA